MSEYVHKSHNVSVLIYHLVCPAKYGRIVFSHTPRRAVASLGEMYFLVMF
jgi:hypothetical protein